MRTGGFTVSLLGACLLLGQYAAAQTPAGESPELRARQELLFDQMLQDPDNLNLMFEHALASIELQDYEAAISTLERMLIFNPQLARAKVELGAAYFRLGAYENARYYFLDVLENHEPPAEVTRRVNGFLDEIGRRTRNSGVSVIATFGATYSSNANLGPPDADVLLGGQPAVLNDAFVESDDFGIRATARARHFVDLNQPDGDVWITDLSLFSLHYFDETQGDLDSFTIQTGPRLSLDERTYGPKLRPILFGDFVTSSNELLYVTGGVGAEYSDSLTEQLNLFAGATVGWREYVDRPDFSGPTARATVGLAYTPEPAVTVSGAVYAETDRADLDANANVEFGARIGGTYRYDSGFEFTERLWAVSAFATAAYRRFDEANPVFDATNLREDIDLRVGASHVFHLTGGWFVQADADYLVRDSDIPNFEIDNIGVALSVGRAF